MRKELKKYSAKNDLAFYLCEKNIPNQKLVEEIVNYFESGEGKRVFKPLELLNLLNEQDNFLLDNVKNRDLVMAHFTKLPLSDLERHVFFGLILKWHGGYPINGLDSDYKAMMKDIQLAFLEHDGQTPEKEFCKHDYEEFKKFRKLEIAFTTALNENVEVKEVLKALDYDDQKKTQFDSFNSLFDTAYKMGAVPETENQTAYFNRRALYNYEFNIWLHEYQNYEQGNSDQYQSLLTKDMFLSFLSYQEGREMEKEIQAKKEADTWKPRGTDNMTFGMDVMPPQEWFASFTNEAKLEWAKQQNNKVRNSFLENTKLANKKIEQFRKEVFVYNKDLEYYKLKRRQLLQGIAAFEDPILDDIVGEIIINKEPDIHLRSAFKEMRLTQNKALKMFRLWLDVIESQIEKFNKPVITKSSAGSDHESDQGPISDNTFISLIKNAENKYCPDGKWHDKAKNSKTEHTKAFLEYFRGVDSLDFIHTLITLEEWKGDENDKMKWHSFSNSSLFEVPVEKDHDHFNIYKRRSEEFALAFHELLKASPGDLMDASLTEINGNLYGLPIDDKNAYLSSILFELYKKVKRVINANICIKEKSDGLGNYIEIQEIVPISFFQPHATKARLQEIISNYSKTQIRSGMGPLVGYEYRGTTEIDNYKRYLISCIFAYYLFIHNLYGICVTNKIDFIKIQRDRGILLLSQIKEGYLGAIGVSKSISNKDNRSLVDYIKEINNGGIGEVSDGGNTGSAAPLFDDVFESLIKKAETSFCPDDDFTNKKQVEVAAFVELIWAAGWLGKSPYPHRVKTCVHFSANRYGVNIMTMIKANKKNDRSSYTRLLKKHFPKNTNFTFPTSAKIGS